MTAASPRPGALRRFLHGEAAGGIVLIVAALAAVLVANLPAAAPGYAALLAAKTGPMTVHQWIDDGLMAIFFLSVGLEIKRECVIGGLADAERRRLPLIAAAAGMAVPALVFLAIAGHEPGLRPGWAIPAATDIAFAIGVLALLGSRVPPAIRLLLTAIAIVDDMGAVAIIALAYTDGLRAVPLAGAGIALVLLWLLHRRGVMLLAPYLLVGAALWACVLQSGIHATIAGILTAMSIPLRDPAASGDAPGPLVRLERTLHPWVGFAILPLFAFANAGVAFRGMAAATLAEPLVLGIVAGLFVGKQAGIFAAIGIADRLGIARRPDGVGWKPLYGMALLAGIGFTMSLFIGGLAFTDPALVDRVRIGVLAGSLASALAGIALLATCRPSAA